MPQDFRDAKIITLNKNYNNCKGISFLIIAGKAFAWIILVCLQIIIISLGMKNVLRHIGGIIGYRPSPEFKYFLSTGSNGGSTQDDGKKDGSVQILCHQHTAIQQTDVGHTIQETRLNTLHLRSIQPPWSTNLARQSVRHQGPFPRWPFEHLHTLLGLRSLSWRFPRQSKTKHSTRILSPGANETHEVKCSLSTTQGAGRQGKQRPTSWHQKGTR